jgi:biopolymer transport protein ExbD
MVQSSGAEDDAMVFSSDSSGSRMASMNITPLVDVMLVLLIIFMVTMPLRTYGIGVDLPQAGPPQPQPIAKPITLKIDAAGQIQWNGSALPMSALRDTMMVEAERYADPLQQPVIQIDTDKDARYDTLAEVLATARNAGLIRIGFVDNGQR